MVWNENITQNSLPPQTLLHIMALVDSHNCTFCQDKIETSNHLFCECQWYIGSDGKFGIQSSTLNGTNLGLLKISFSTFSLAEPNVLKLIFKSTRFVKFVANLAQFGWQLCTSLLLLMFLFHFLICVVCLWLSVWLVGWFMWLRREGFFNNTIE